MIVRAFITHKKAEHFTDCQDRFGVNIGTKSIAVSDGMGSSWQQKIWAQILVDEFTRHDEWLPTQESIKPLCHKWREQVIASIQKLKETNAPQNIIIRNENSLAERRSAGATFVGVRFNDNSWSGVVLGDSCLIEWNGQNAEFHTSQNVDAFDSYPDYFDSDDTKEGKGEPKAINGSINNNCLLLVSDPFSDFLLEHKKKGDIAKYIAQILSLSSHEDFERLVEAWRDAGMHNDDTTLVIVEKDEKDTFSISHQDNLETLKSEEIQNNKKPGGDSTAETTKTEEPVTPQQSGTQSSDEKDFSLELREWLEQPLKKIFGKRKAKEFLRRFFDSIIQKIKQHYDITKK